MLMLQLRHGLKVKLIHVYQINHIMTEKTILIVFSFYLNIKMVKKYLTNEKKYVILS